MELKTEKAKFERLGAGLGGAGLEGLSCDLGSREEGRGECEERRRCGGLHGDLRDLA